MLNVTQSFIPPIEEYMTYVQRSFDKVWLTNRGELVQELEQKLAGYLNLPHITLTANGTLPLQIAIKSLALEGQIITTPFSFVATTSSIIWENCTPVFVDIEPEYFTIDPKKIAAAITPKTTGILATHIFGNPCAVDEIEKIAKEHHLKVIYDGAHAFGVKYKGKSIFAYGDVSTCSFHATKLMHTGEGGAFFSKDVALQKKMFFQHNFGHNGPYHFEEVGINAKMSELHAAMGLAVFNHLEEIIKHRQKAVEIYKDLLKTSGIDRFKIRPHTEWNYHYFPVIFPSEEHLLKAVKNLAQEQIFAKRYYYPSLNNLPYLKQIPMEISDDLAHRVLCLPLSHDISKSAQVSICEIILHSQIN